MDLKTVAGEVQTLLAERPETRGSDEKLYGAYLIGRIGLPSVIDFMYHFEDYAKQGIASFNTVSRARRKIQETHPELRPPQEVIEARDELQGDFFDWVRGL